MRAYKFLDAECGLKSLYEKRLKQSRVCELNDPFELRPYDITDLDRRRVFLKTREDMNKDRVVVCFSSCWCNPVIWAHYSDKHRGLCLGFEIPEMKGDVENDESGYVSYIGEPLQDFPSDFSRLGNTERYEIVRKILFTKFKNWEYEDEIRQWGPLQHEEDGLHFLEFGEELRLVEVIIGASCRLPRSEIRRALGSSASEVKIIKARAAYDKFEMVEDEDWAGGEPMEETIYTLGQHLVAYLDVLGQREKFRQLRLPKTPEEYSRVEGVLRDTVGFVLELRKVFRSNFQSLEAGLNSKLGAGEVVHTPDFVGFSDSFIAWVALRNEDQHLTPNIKIFCTLSAPCIVMLTSLASKHALRGGIEIGLATEMSPGEIYGTALERAYCLESRQADYPRVLIGDDLWKYLSLGLKEFEKLTTPAAERMQKLIRREMQLTTVDADGRRILDYLGPGIANIATPDQANTLVKPAYQFVLDQQEDWLSKGNTQLSGRYALLRQYFESHLSSWGIPLKGR
jgi:hypothetical protein